MSLLKPLSACSRPRFALVFFSAALIATATLSPRTALAQSWSDTSIYQFCSVDGVNCTDGGDPLAGLVQGADGNFYGLTSAEGSNAAGTAFKLNPAGTQTLLHAFCGQSDCADGSGPAASLILGSDGNFYGTTPNGGSSPYNAGVAFKMTPSGTVTPIYEFCNAGGAACEDGEYPNGLVQGSDGNFYGTTNRGGAHGFGSVFQLTTAGVLTSLYSFCQNGGNCTDGGEPVGALVEGPDGAFYGMTGGAGPHASGAVFRITDTGDFSVLYAFCTVAGCTDGAFPGGGLALGTDGKLYGYTTLGGAASKGVIFSLTTAGGESVIHSFCTSSPCSDGQYPAGPLVQGSDGRFYGTANFAGNFTSDCSGLGCGTVFSFDGSSFSIPYAFCPQAGCPDGFAPVGGVIQAADGNLYGTTQNGGTGADACIDGCGTAFRLTPSSALAASASAPVQLSLSKSSVAAGSSVTLSWNVLNAFSLTMQQCYAFVKGAGAGSWAGKQSGKLSGKLFSGSASITPTTAGTYTYALTCGGVETGFATLTVSSSKNATSTGLAVSPNPVSVGQSATLKATVTSASGTPSGTVTFSTDGVSLGSASLNGSGVATLTASTNGIAPATYPLSASYSGNSSYNSSASPTVNVALSKAPTTTALTISPTSVTPPANVTLSATVKRSASGATGTPTGKVTFAVGTDVLAIVTVNSKGVAAITAPSAGYPAGKYTVKATYSGDSADSSSTSSAVTVTVN